MFTSHEGLIWMLRSWNGGWKVLNFIWLQMKNGNYTSDWGVTEISVLCSGYLVHLESGHIWNGTDLTLWHGFHLLQNQAVNIADIGTVRLRNACKRVQGSPNAPKSNNSEPPPLPLMAVRSEWRMGIGQACNGVWTGFFKEPYHGSVMSFDICGMRSLDRSILM